MSRFVREYERSRRYEIATADWIRTVRRVYALATYDFSGQDNDKAPKLLAPLGLQGFEDLVLPDLQCWGDKGSFWVEVKLKSRANWYKKGQYLVTGISRRLWRHYLQVESVTGSPVYLLFLHEREQEARGASLDWLKGHVSHEYTGPRMCRGGMVFWPWLEIPRWARLDAIRRAA